MATVLVVDDAAANRELLRTLLAYRGHDVLEAEQAIEALRLARLQRPDVVVTDVLMPGMDGYQLARELRADPSTADTALVFYSGNYSADELQPIADAYGVTRVVLKSADPMPLLQAVDEVLADSPPSVPAQTAEDFHREHVHTVNTKLVEKIRQLHSSEERFRAMAQSSPIGIVLTDVHGTAFFVNARLEQILGRPARELLGAGWLECLPPDMRDEALATVTASRPDSEHHFRLPIVRRDGATSWLNTHLRATCDSSGQVDGAVGIIDDVTAVVLAEERRRAEQLRRESDARRRVTERLESLRRLAGGVAHDYNNVLGIILSYAELLGESITEEAADGGIRPAAAKAMLADLGSIRQAGERAAGLTKHLQWFGSQIALKPAMINLNVLVEQETQAVRDIIGDGIELITRLDKSLAGVAVDPGQIGQVLRNLVSNARDAMPRGGTLLIETRNRTQEAADRTDEDGRTAPAGGYVRLTVRDGGVGMAPEVAERAVEPFYTTKPRGTGAGLGLATAYGMATQAGGDLRIETAPAQGTTVHLDLPAIRMPAPERPRPTAVTISGSERPTILVVDDEDGIRDVVERILSGAGYDVLTAPNATAALATADEHPGPLHGLVTDVVMPGMHGGQLARRLTAELPGLPVLFMSGYADPLAEDSCVDVAHAAVLAKPFTSADLLQAVRELVPKG